MCYLATCSSPGAWKPILKFRSRSNGPATILHFKSISTCEEHRKTSTVDSFLSEEGFDKLARHLRDAGKSVPIRRLTTLDWEPAPIEESVPGSETAIVAANEPLPT